MAKAKRKVTTGRDKLPKKTANSAARESGFVYIANHHSARIVLPREQAGNISTPPVNLEPGELTKINASEWAVKKKNKVIDYYLSNGTIEEIKKGLNREVHVSVGRTSDPPVPEHLKSDKEEFVGQQGIGKAKIIKSVVG